MHTHRHMSQQGLFRGYGEGVFEPSEKSTMCPAWHLKPIDSGLHGAAWVQKIN